MQSTGELASVYACFFLLKSLLRILRIRSTTDARRAKLGSWGSLQKGTNVGFVTGFFIAVCQTVGPKILKTSQNKPELLLQNFVKTSQQIYRASRFFPHFLFPLHKDIHVPPSHHKMVCQFRKRKQYTQKYISKCKTQQKPLKKKTSTTEQRNIICNLLKQQNKNQIALNTPLITPSLVVSIPSRPDKATWLGTKQLQFLDLV